MQLWEIWFLPCEPLQGAIKIHNGCLNVLKYYNKSHSPINPLRSLPLRFTHTYLIVLVTFDTVREVLFRDYLYKVGSKIVLLPSASQKKVRLLNAWQCPRPP